VYIWYIAYFGISVHMTTCGFVYRTRKAKWNIFGKLSIVWESLSMPLFLLGLSRCQCHHLNTILVSTSLSILLCVYVHLGVLYTFVSCMSRSPGWNGASNAAILNPQNQRLQISDLNKRLLWTCIDQWTNPPSPPLLKKYTDYIPCSTYDIAGDKVWIWMSSFELPHVQLPTCV
jgi:hypothetical protein